MAFATLTHANCGTRIRLTNDGFQFAGLPVTVHPGEEPTTAADRTLAARRARRLAGDPNWASIAN